MKNGEAIAVQNGIVLHVHPKEVMGLGLGEIMRGNNSAPFPSAHFNLLTKAFPALASVPHFNLFSYHSVLSGRATFLAEEARHEGADNYFLALADNVSLSE